MTPRLSWLSVTLVLAAALALFDRYALATYLYWRYPWSDTISHTLGAAAIGTFSIALIGKTFRPFVYSAAILVFCIGWEVFEQSIGATSAKYVVLDTKSDLLFDAIGASAAYIIARFTLWHSA